jgi:hypothetical protein
VRRDIRVSVHAHRFAIESNNLLGAGVVEVERVVDLALDEERGRAVGLKLETEPEKSALAGPVPVAANEVRIAAQGWAGHLSSCLPRESNQ